MTNFSSRRDQRGEHALGMDEAITRRDFLNSTLLASGSVLLTAVSPLELFAQRNDAWDGPGGVGDYARANGNTLEVMLEGHKIRDRAYERVSPAAIEEVGSFDCVVVGGGISG